MPSSTRARTRGAGAPGAREAYELAQQGDFVLVTDNGTDFRRLLGTAELHPGLILIPGSAGLEYQQRAARRVIEWIEGAAHGANQAAADCMVNRLVQIDETGRIIASELPRQK